MARITQYYGPGGVPLDLRFEPGDPVRAWRSHRQRLRGWLGTLPVEAWAGPTRCEGWDVATLVRHLLSGSTFLGYTLHQARKGIATEALRDFDTRATVQAATAAVPTLAPADLLVALAAADASVDREIDALDGAAGPLLAEAAPGHMSPELIVCHFLFDSWVHERDLREPVGRTPAADPLEAELVVGYVLGLAQVWDGSLPVLGARLEDVAVRVVARRVDGRVQVDRPAVADDVTLSGDAGDVVDRATGRSSGPVAGDPAGLAVLDRLATLL